MSIKVKVLFVCMGNICRSPTAHGVFEQLVNDKELSHLFEIDSAGTHAYHIGSEPDKRAQSTALSHGVDLSYIRGRQICGADFETYDYILAMDRDNYKNLLRISPEEYRSRVYMFLSFIGDKTEIDEVPDPYYGGIRGFENVYSLVDAASLGLLNTIVANDL